MPDSLPLACGACRACFPQVLDASLVDGGRRRALGHLAGCADCRAALAAVRRAAEAPAPAEALDPRTRQELLELFRTWRAGRRGE